MVHWRLKLPMVALVALAIASVLGKNPHGIGFFW